jgi:NitT/TauT family transport system ATP-binding protein
MLVIRILSLSAGYPGKKILEDVNLQINPGEVVALVGRSGCGKSTLLRCIAGLMTPTGGRIEKSKRVQTAILFQEALLQPWLSVREIIELPGRIGSFNVDSAALLRLVRLEGCGDLRPHQLSGGMQRRVALARALAQRPDLLLLDEPYSSLDEATRNFMYEELVGLNVSNGLTVLLVTHSLTEALYIADRVVVLAGAPATVARDLEVCEAKPRDMAQVHSTDFLVKCHELRIIVQSDVSRQMGAG